MTDLPGASSGRSRVRGFSTEPVRKESQTPTPTESGMGLRRGYGSVSKQNHHTDVIPMRSRYAKELTWAHEHLPDENDAFVCIAIESLKRNRVKVTTGSVRSHLEATGRDRKATDARLEKLGMAA